MLGRAQFAVRAVITCILLGMAAVAGVVIWNHYVTGPWTRDGQVLAYVVNIAPEVSGRIVKLNVTDNQAVRKGDVLYEIDPVDYQVALAAAQANVNSQIATLNLRVAEARRRQNLTTLSTSQEELQTYQSQEEVARAGYAGSLAQLSQAHINLDRTQVRSPVNGYVTNLVLREGDYATAGGRNISVLDSDSYWVYGFFEETKLASIHSGDPATIELMGYPDPLQGHVEGIARGISTPNTAAGPLGLASVNPVFSWVRLAQRIPVRVHIDQVPANVHLAAGMTATVSVGAAAGTRHGLVSNVVTEK